MAQIVINCIIVILFVSFLVFSLLHAPSTPPMFVTGAYRSTGPRSHLALTPMSTMPLFASMVTTSNHVMSGPSILKTNIISVQFKVSDTSLQTLIGSCEIFAAVAVRVSANIEIIFDVERFVATTGSPFNKE